MPKFFIPMEDVQGDSLVIREDAHHILHVLRKEIGDCLTVCDGCGQDYECEIVSASADQVICRILEQHMAATEPEIQLTLFQGLPKAEKMEWLLQKGVEIGIYDFIPVMTGRSVVKLDGKKADSKLVRWNKITQSAAKQSGRGLLPEVKNVVSVEQAIKTFDKYDLILVLYEEDRGRSLKEILRTQKTMPRKIALWIGPEGGFDPAEITLLTNAGAVTAGLGPRILRTETAGMTAATIVLYEYDQM